MSDVGAHGLAEATERGSVVGVSVTVEVGREHWRDGLETYAGLVAELLAAHRWRQGQPTCTGCDWAPTAHDVEERYLQHCEHQAQVLPVVELPSGLQGGPQGGLREAREARCAAAALEREAVLVARGAGWSWPQIGGALDLSGQILRRRYGHEVELGRWPDSLRVPG